jgi:hypothetical protein
VSRTCAVWGQVPGRNGTWLLLSWPRVHAAPSLLGPSLCVLFRLSWGLKLLTKLLFVSYLLAEALVLVMEGRCY